MKEWVHEHLLGYVRECGPRSQLALVLPFINLVLMDKLMRVPS